jgi:hypothetical protein
MKKLIYLLPVLIMFGCEKDIYPELPSAKAPLVIDALLYHKSDAQTIRITRANTYFDSSTPIGIEGAIVSVTDVESPQNVFDFVELEPGKYVWTPDSPSDSFGVIGRNYQLEISLQGKTYTAFSSLRPVPQIDSITWRLEKGAFFGGMYFAEFWSQDLPGKGDTYWIKAWKNGQLLTKPSELNIAFDASFSDDDNTDGLTFIQPIRYGINPFDLDDRGQLKKPYILGDSVYVEINSITYDVFFFLQQVQIQTDRPGGFGELFSTPLANIESNIRSSDPKEKVVGLFSVSATQGLGRKFTTEAILTRE